MRPRLTIVAALFAVLAVPAGATNTHMASFENVYAPANNSRIDACALCHVTDTLRNSYGIAYAGASHDFKAIESLDSDGDGFTNLSEIAAFTFPGNVTDKPRAAVGSIMVTLAPAGAVSAGAQWRVGATGAYQNSGVTVSGLTAGGVTLQFKTVSGWTTPPEQSAIVFTGKTAMLTVSYTQTQVSVPNVVGGTETAASAAIISAGLTLGTVTRLNSQTVPAGTVISQTPTAGTAVNPGTAVSLMVSLGPAAVLVPNVVGQAQATAASNLTAAGLTVGTITQVYSDTAPSGVVVGQAPSAGSAVAAGSAVDLTVSKGPAPLTVPNVVGSTQTAAAEAITAAGLVVGAVTSRHDAVVAEGLVAVQNPAAGMGASPGSAVALVMSLGPGPVTVPDVVNQTQPSATTVITSAGLVLGAVTQEYSATVSAGRIISQNPPSATQAEAGSAVALVVSLGPQPVSVPDVTGLTQDEATAAITNAGLAVGQVTEEASDTVPAGSVISQTPAAGALVAPASLVNLTVSSGAGIAGCTCGSTGKGIFSLDTPAKAWGDLFLAGLGLVMLGVMARRRP